MNTTSDFEIEQDKPGTGIPERGHAKNAYNFRSLIAFCQSQGTVYNPSNNRLTIPQLQVLEQSAFDKIQKVQEQREVFNRQTNNRRKAFEDIKPFATKILNAFAASGVDKTILEEAKGINKKIQGVVLRGILGTNSNELCASQQSYDRKIEHLGALISLLENNPVYHPNEEELKLSALQSKLKYLQTHNTNLAHSYALYSEALHERNHLLYNPQNGLLQTVKEVKQYVKSVYGANSSQYHQIGQLQFKVRAGE